jgi:DNA modification methylase
MRCTQRYDDSWSFDDLSRKETNYITHGYHKYPAKFIPQLVNKLLVKYSKPHDLVLDPFGGCGTTVVESKVMGRRSIGVDINDVAVLIAKAKSRAINPKVIAEKNISLLDKIEPKIKHAKDVYDKAHPRLKYWFKREQFNQLSAIYNEIEKESNERIRTFYSCCFSDILKPCSIWFARSIKPMKDITKKQPPVYEAFKKHLLFMTRQNKEFFEFLQNNEHRDTDAKMVKGDARNLNLSNNSVDLIITSPPYATSYEYADIHQLSILWFKFSDNLLEFKKNFVGTLAGRESLEYECTSSKAAETIKALEKVDARLARHLVRYYADLSHSLSEMYRVLKRNKYVCLIMGDTCFKDIKIKNVDISVELMNQIGFSVEKVIRRKLSSKIFTPYRDKNGKFTNGQKGTKRNIYEYEYILIAKK